MGIDIEHAPIEFHRRLSAFIGDRFKSPNSPILAVLTLCLSLCGCSRYSDFTLPVAAGGDLSLTYSLDALPDPVMGRGEGWESGDVLNPSVFRDGGQLVNYYSAFDGRTWHTGRATSPDGVHWQKSGRVLSPNGANWEGSYIAANGAAMQWQGRVLHWFVAGPRTHPQIGLDGRVVLPAGPYMSWDEIGVSDPYVVRIEPYFYLYYTGLDRGAGSGWAWRGRAMASIGRSCGRTRFWNWATSAPSMRTGWASRPYGSPQATIGCSTPAANPRRDRRLGLARSLDGVHWKQAAGRIRRARRLGFEGDLRPDGAGGRRRHPGLVRRRRCGVAG